jgi:hypothetical protein
MPGSNLPGSCVGDYCYFDDFVDGDQVIDNSGKFSATADQACWLLTIIDTDNDNNETIANSDSERGGVVKFTNNVDALDSLELQMNGEAFVVAEDKDIYFEMRFKVDDADDVRWGVGLADTDTTVFDLTGSGYTNILTAAHFIGFAAADAADGNVDYLAADGHSAASTTTFTNGDTGVDMSDDTYVTVAFWVHSDERITFYVNGDLKATVTSSTYIPGSSDYMSPWFTIANDGTNDGSAVMEVDYIFVTATR